MKEKIKVLADFLKIKASEIEQVTWRDNCFTPNYDNAKKALETICNMYESANDFLYEVIDNRIGFDEFIKMAVKTDGRGHFIAFYDGLEHYSNGYYIYRID